VARRATSAVAARRSSLLFVCAQSPSRVRTEGQRRWMEKVCGGYTCMRARREVGWQKHPLTGGVTQTALGLSARRVTDWQVQGGRVNRLSAETNARACTTAPSTCCLRFRSSLLPFPAVCASADGCGGLWRGLRPPVTLPPRRADQDSGTEPVRRGNSAAAWRGTHRGGTCATRFGCSRLLLQQACLPLLLRCLQFPIERRPS
jgi:hypothetical protein